MSAKWHSYYTDTDEEDCEEVERLLFRSTPEDTTWDSSFSTVSTNTDDSFSWSQSSTNDVDISFATTVEDEDLIPPIVKPGLSAPSFGFLKSTEECLEEVARTVVMIQGACSSWDPPRRHWPAYTSNIRSSGCNPTKWNHLSLIHPHSEHHPPYPLYWKHSKFGDLEYATVPVHLSHLQQAGNRWTYSLTGPWYPRAKPVVGDIHFSPSEVIGFDYWVYILISGEGVWCLTPLAQPHPLTSELVLQHLSVDSPPQWVLSRSDLEVDLM